MRNNYAQIKVEPNFVLRSSVFTPEIKSTSAWKLSKKGCFEPKIEYLILDWNNPKGFRDKLERVSG